MVVSVKERGGEREQQRQRALLSSPGSPTDDAMWGACPHPIPFYSGRGGVLVFRRVQIMRIQGRTLRLGGRRRSILLFSLHISQGGTRHLAPKACEVSASRRFKLERLPELPLLHVAKGPRRPGGVWAHAKLPYLQGLEAGAVACCTSKTAAGCREQPRP